MVDEVSKLKQELNGEIVVLGSPQLARALIEHDLVDELRLSIYPVVLGAGARLFGETSGKKPMRLVDTRTVGDGIAIVTYEPVRDAERASDGPSLQDKRAAALRQAGIRGRPPERATRDREALRPDLAGGKVRRIRVFLDRQEAFEAVGLRE